MILAQYNILNFYTSKTSRAWNKLESDGGNKELFRIFLQTGKIPAVQIMVDAATSATIQVYDVNDTAIGSALAMTVESSGHLTTKRIVYTGTTLTGQESGDYYLKVVNGSDTYYSDVFGWTSDSDKLSDLLKISAVSSNITVGRYYTMNLTNFTFECYVNADYLGLAPDIEEEITQRGGVNNVVYSDLVVKREFEIYGVEYLYKFLLGLRILESNGTVTITHNGISYTANDIMVEKTEDHSPDTMQLKLSFVDVSETLSVSNELN